MPSASTIGRDLLNVPFPEMVKSLGIGIAEAQLELDRVSMEIAQLMSGQDEGARPTLPSDDTKKFFTFDEDEDDDNAEEKRSTKIRFGGQYYSLLELGFTPTFYQFVDTIIEVKMSISMSRTKERKTETNKRKLSGKLRLFRRSAGVSATSVTASYASKYSYSAEGSSLLRTKLVPVPPPPILEDRIRRLLDDTAENSTS
ncbi:hypothetical protein [Marinibactrum halimedae]|uniref:Uncharacterized protein n=1 Tax=Marinibactrum halimedae TaxID=1444977 RepID=A0AA37T320_9GAMM|nr:hypothetical protein [Marinibactrum halimedae]MCD9460274.1 hypothetical protein [Marinibactrum halimedae]GLS24361.1 hypothetical protein GCM10007877_00720 [Marinibactrum halimedae]